MKGLRCAVLVAAPALALLRADPASDGRPPTGDVDAGRSEVEVDVARSGLLAAFGHGHRIIAPVSTGRVLAENGPRAEIEFDARSLRVADAGLSDADREKIQATMEGPEVLDAGRYPEIAFRSTAVEAEGTGRWSVAGSLTLHGATRPVRAEVTLVDRRYRGSVGFRLTDFGIHPPAVAGGAVRVRDEVRIVFEVAVREPGA